MFSFFHFRGLLPFAASSSNPAFLVLSSPSFFPSLSASKLTGLEKEVRTALSPVESPLESFFTGSRFKYRFPSITTSSTLRAVSNRRRLQDLLLPSKRRQKAEEADHEPPPGGRGGGKLLPLSSSVSSSLRGDSEDQLGLLQPSGRMARAEEETFERAFFPSDVVDDATSTSSGMRTSKSHSSEAWKQTDANALEGGHGRRIEPESLGRREDSRKPQTTGEAKEEEMLQKNSGHEPRVFVFSDDWKEQFPAYAVSTDTILGKEKKKIREEQDTRPQPRNPPVVCEGCGRRPLP